MLISRLKIHEPRHLYRKTSTLVLDLVFERSILIWSDYVTHAYFEAPAFIYHSLPEMFDFYDYDLYFDWWYCPHYAQF